MSEFDHFLKSTLKVKYYARYTDDFVVISKDRQYLENLIDPIETFLRDTLHLSLHPTKTSIRKYSEGIDFLGYIIFPHFRLVRKRTWKRMLRNFEKKVELVKNGTISKENLDSSLQSYLAVLSHADAYNKSEGLKNKYWLK